MNAYEVYCLSLFGNVILTAPRTAPSPITTDRANTKSALQ